jgi:hypothetical protein
MALRRVQLMLTDRQYAFLQSEAARTGLAMSELTRRAIDKTYRPFARPRRKGFELALSVSRQPDAATVGRRDRLF